MAGRVIGWVDYREADLAVVGIQTRDLSAVSIGSTYVAEDRDHRPVLVRVTGAARYAPEISSFIYPVASVGPAPAGWRPMPADLTTYLGRLSDLIRRSVNGTSSLPGDGTGSSRPAPLPGPGIGGGTAGSLWLLLLIAAGVVLVATDD
jgi:hypothetical protein